MISNIFNHFSFNFLMKLMMARQFTSNNESYYYDLSSYGASSPLFLRHPHLDPTCPLFKIFVSPPLFFVPPPIKTLQTVPPTLTQPSPVLIRPTNLLWFKQISKRGDFTNSTIAFYQKSIFNF